MTVEVKTTAAEQDKKTEPTKPEVDGAKKEEAPKEATIGEALNTTPPPKVEAKEETVPLATFLDMKKDYKDLQRDMREMKKNIEDGATKKEVNADLKALAEKHNVDEDFLSDFAKAVRSQTETELETKFSSKLEPLEKKERAKEIDKAFNTHFSKALEQMPEFEGVVNKEVIKSLSLVPGNANKTFTQLIEESYGHLVTGKRSIDSVTARSGKNDSSEVDHDRANRDPEYFKEVMANPTMKKKYNDGLVKSLSRHL